MNRSFSARALSLLLCAAMLFSPLTLSSSAAEGKTDKRGFVWGVNGHGDNDAYPSALLDRQMAKAADMGATGYRINFTPPYDAATGSYDWSYFDQILDTAEKYGLTVFLVLFDWHLHYQEDYSPEWLRARARDIAAHAKGRVGYWQLANEQDLSCNIKNTDGTDPFNYYGVFYKPIFERLDAISKGLYEGDPKVKRVVNIGLRDTGFLEMLQKDGLAWEVNAYDWYSEGNDASGIDDAGSILDILSAMPQPEIIISEANHAKGDMNVTEEAQRDYILADMDKFYNGAWPKLTGYYIYELLDEPINGEDDMESYFGIVHSNIGGTEWTDKLAFGAVKERIASYRTALFWEDALVPVAIGGVVLAGAGVVAVILIRRRKKKKA